VGFFELKLHIHTLWSSESYFTSCEKEHIDYVTFKMVDPMRLPSMYYKAALISWTCLMYRT